MKFQKKIFKYPFDYHLLSKDIKKLTSNLNKSKNNKLIKLYILSGSTVHNLPDQIKLFLSNFGIYVDIKVGNYNNYLEETLFSNEIINFNPDWVYIHTNHKNIVDLPDLIESKKQISDFYFKNINLFENILSSKQLKNKKIIINNFEKLPSISQSVITKNQNKFNSNDLILTLNDKLKKLTNKFENVYLNDIEYLSSLIGINNWIDNNFWAAFKIAFSNEAFPYLSSSISSIISASEGKSKKVLVCDLDNTLWGGNIGDIGYENIELGPETPNGNIYLEIQNYILKLIKLGIIVTVVSKNDRKIAETGFKNKFSKLKKNDFVLFYANYENKSQNINKIIEVLNIGQDSVVFIDDNPAELEEVKKALPDVTTIGYTNNPIEIINNIERIGYFNKVDFTKEDKKRNKFYIENSKRLENQKSFENFSEFLKSLKMKANITRLKKDSLKRANQLINKTNQFNLSYEKMTEQKLSKYINNKKYLIIESNLVDKFGDNGIISILYGNIHKNKFVIDNWVMSCRVFKRELEFAIIDELIRICLLLKINIIEATVIKGDRNKYIYDLFDKLNFNKLKKIKNKICYDKKIDKNYTKLNSNILINEK